MNRERLQAAIELAREAVARGALRDVPNGFGPHPTRDYRAGHFTFEGEAWVVCTAPMISSSFQLLDAAVRQRLERKAMYAVAVLGARPERDGKGPEPTVEYLRSYQQVAWSALGVAWVLDAGSQAGEFLANPAGPALERGSFAALVDRIEKKLAGLHISPRPEASRAAEEIIRPRVEQALQEVDASFRPEAKKYGGFWRRPEADGMWRRAAGIPATFALEVKLNEDINNPLCQAVEPLGQVDAMVYVRLTRPNAKSAVPALAVEAKTLLEASAPMKYLSVPTE